MVITRYILKNLIAVTIFVTFILTLLIILTQSLRFLEMIIEAGAPAMVFFQLIGLAIPRFIEILLPLAIVTAILFIYNRMISENEMIVLRAAGSTQFDLMRPALKLSLISFIILLFLGFWGAPVAHHKLSDLRSSIQTEYASLLLRAGVFNSVDNGLMIYMDKRLPDGNLGGLVIHDARIADEPPSTIIAASGQLITDLENTTQVTVFDGTRQVFNPSTQSLDILNFEQYNLHVVNAQSDARSRRKDANERTINELIFPADWDDLSPRDQNEIKGEIHRRITQPLSVFPFALLGLACLLVGSFNRRGQARRVISAAVMIILLQSIYLAIGNALDNQMWALPAAYLSLIIPTFLAIYAISPNGEVMRKRALALLFRPKPQEGTV